MIYEFDDKYRYIGSSNIDDDKELYRFDKEKANALANNKEYDALADYLSQYMFIDGEAQANHRAYINKLRSSARHLQSYYSKVPEEELGTVNFANSIFTPGGLKALRNQTILNASGERVPKYATDGDFEKDNHYAAQYIKDLDELGSTKDRKATALKLVFSDKKYGFFNLDFLAKDYNEYYDVLSKSGMTEQEIKELGGNIYKENGNIIVQFDKNAGCCTRLLNALTFSQREANNVKIIGVDENGEIDVPNAVIPGLVGFGQIITSQEKAKRKIQALQQIVSAAQNSKDAVEIKQHLASKVYSSTVFDIQTDRTDILNELLNTGQIQWQEYNARIKEEKGVNIPARVRAISYSDYEIYSDYFNEDGSEVRQRVAPDDWDELKNIISAVPASKIHFLGETSGGRIGVHITIDGDALYSHGDKDSKKGKASYTNKPIQIFIPGFCTEEIEQQMYKDTGLRAIKKWNDMLDYGYKYQKKDGSQIAVDENGTVYRYDNGQVYIDNSSDAKDKALRELNEDFIKEDAEFVKFMFINNKGEIDYPRYEQAAKMFSIKAMDELYPSIPFEDMIGTQLLNGSTIDSITALFDEDLIEDVYMHPQNYPYKSYEKLKHLYDMYLYLTLDLTYGYNFYSSSK